ncbi:MAG: Transposase for transposon Tn5, partial [Sphingobacteriales bacterium]|nr:Transposase for transposon Tn5 [Sphingobacteriales bacterium]
MSEESLIAELCERSSSICSGRHVLCIQDTTEMNYYSHRQRIKEESGLGRLDSPGPALGFKMHSTLLVDADEGNVLGFSDIKLWHRPLAMPTRAETKCKSFPIEEKESYKWISAAQESKRRLTDAAMITFVEDREADIYEQLSTIHQDNIHYIIRSRNNRITTDEKRAWDKLKMFPSVGNFTLNLPTDHRKNRVGQKVTLEVRYTSITIPRGDHIKNGSAYPKEVTLNLVEAYQETAKGISWKLLTSHPINSYEDAYRIVQWYSERWLIEQMHRLLKQKGFQIEDSQLESGWAIRKLCIIMMSSLLRIFQMNLAYNQPEGGQPIEEVFNNEEIHCMQLINKKLQGKTIKSQNLHNSEKLNWATWIIARLGGWKGYESQGKPGIIVLKRGLDKFNAIYYGWRL